MQEARKGLFAMGLSQHGPIMPSIAGHVCFRAHARCFESVTVRIASLSLLALAMVAPAYAEVPQASPPAASTSQASNVPPAAPPLSEASARHLKDLQQRARELKLADSLMWRTLLHYRVQPLTRVDRSLADDGDFFLSPRGVHDLQAELDATLAAFFDPTPRHALNQAAACRFIGRFKWLHEQLQFDASLMPAADCTRYQQWRAGIQTSKVTLIFPSAYLNSPASMYGHTFLRLDPAPGTAQSNSPLLSYAINYAADGNENEGLAFAFKGLTGLYRGLFSNTPYYLRIRDYNDLENRDIWEYELSLTPQEIDRLMAHTWELGPTQFDYFFFDENCSYHLLSILDASRPELRLSEQFTWWAIPLDTVKAVTRTPGLLKAVHYRPSNSTELHHRATLLGEAGASRAQALYEQRLSPDELARQEPDEARQALILETAERLTAYEATRKHSSDAETQKQRMHLLMARAKLPPGQTLTVPTPAMDPSQSHDTARTDVMIGQRDGHGMVLMQARPAYHEPIDPEAGYQRGAGIQFFDIAISKEAHQPAQLERLVPVNIVSLAPRSPLLATRSWRVHVGIERSDFRLANGRRPLGLNLNGGPGLAFELAPGQRLLGYALVDNQLRWDRSLREQAWAIGTGLAAGLIGDLTPNWRIQMEAFGRVYADHQPRDAGWFLQSRYSVNQHWNVVARCGATKRAGTPVMQECLAGVQRYW